MGAKDKMKKKNRILFLLVILILMVNFFYTDSKIIRTSYKEYKAGNSSNLVLDKILSDNQLKQEIPHMFNYASNGNYVIYRDYNYEIVNDPNYVTNGLYSTEDDDGTSYYFRGDVNNNLVFGAYDEDYYVNIFDMGDEGGDNIYALLQNSDNCEEFMTDYIGDSDNVTEYCKYVKIKLASKGDEMSWKIVRVNGDGTLRLMYNGPGVTNLTNYWGIVYASNGNESIGKEGSIGNIPYNFDYYDPKYTGYTYDNGVDSFIKKEVDSWYNNTLGSNPLYDSKVIEGKFCSDTSGYREMNDYSVHYYSHVFSGYDRLFTDTGDKSPILKCPETSEGYGESYNLKAGLITADELFLMGSMEVDNIDMFDNIDFFWTMTPSGYDDRSSDDVRGTRVFIGNPNNGVAFDRSNGLYGLRPVINVSTENMTLTGDGTEDNPYRLEEVANNNYKGTVTIEEGSSVDDVTAFEEELNLDGVTWTSEDESIARIENGKILGLKEGTTTITGVSSDGLTNYLIEVNVIKNPVTNSMIYVGIGVILILVLGTVLYAVYRIKTIVKED